MKWLKLFVIMIALFGVTASSTISAENAEIKLQGKIAYLMSCGGGGGVDLYLLDLQTLKSELVTWNCTFPGHYSWSPDNKMFIGNLGRIYSSSSINPIDPIALEPWSKSCFYKKWWSRYTCITHIWNIEEKRAPRDFYSPKPSPIKLIPGHCTDCSNDNWLVGLRHPEKTTGSVIFIVKIDGTELQEIYTISNVFMGVDSPIGDPVWSPDGKQIAFVVQKEKKLNYITYPDKIMVIDKDGKNLKKIEAKNTILCKSKPKFLSFADIYNKDPIAFFSPKELSWSESDKLFFHSGNTFEYLFMFDMKTQTLHEIPRDPFYSECGSFSWFPNEQKIVFCARSIVADDATTHQCIIVGELDGNKWNLDILDKRSYKYKSHIDQLGRSFDASPVWSPDGKKIAFIETDAMSRNKIIILDEASKDRLLDIKLDAPGHLAHIHWIP